MPLLHGKPYRPNESLPEGLTRNHDVWVINTTGEVFMDYESYLEKVRQYNEPIWECSKTGRSGLVYLQAVMSENADKTEKETEREPLGKPLPALQMTLSSSSSPSGDRELQMIGPFLRNRAKTVIEAFKAEFVNGELSVNGGNSSSDAKKRRSSGKESDQSKSKIDAKQIPGTVKHTFYKTLEAVGPNGASVSYLHQRLKDLDIQVSWASGSARNCIASTLTHDNAFARLGPAHGNPGHYTLDELKPEEPESKREYPQNENEAVEIQRNNGRCMKCLKARRSDNSPLVFCDYCPGAVHWNCVREHDAALKEIGQSCEIPTEKQYMCYKCIQKRKMAERQKVVRQKREEEKLKRQEERGLNPNDSENAEKEHAERKHRVHATKVSTARYPIEDLDLTESDHRYKEEWIQGPILPDPETNSGDILMVMSICEFFAVFGSELDERFVPNGTNGLSVAELMYSLCWPFDSLVLKNAYLSLLKAAVHQAAKIQDAPSEIRQWNSTLDTFTWPEILKNFLLYTGEKEILQQIEQEMKIEEDGEEKLFLEISPRLHLTILLFLVDYISSSNMIHGIVDVRIAEARKLESEIVKREMNKVKAKGSSNSQLTTSGPEGGSRILLLWQGYSTGADLDDKEGEGTSEHRRSLRRRQKTPEENKTTQVQDELMKLEEKLDACRILIDPIGLDRHRNMYYWLPTLPETLTIMDSDRENVRFIRSKEEVDRVMTGLNARGIREKQLNEALKEDYDHLNLYFAPKEFSFDLGNIERGVVCAELDAFHKNNRKQNRMPIEKLKSEQESLALKTMGNRLHKMLGAVASVDDEIHNDLKNIRSRLNCATDRKTMMEFLSSFSEILKKVFQDKTERQNGKTQMKLNHHLQTLENTSQMTISKMSLFVATLRDIVEPLVRTKNKSLQAALEAKRKRERSQSEQSSTTDEHAPSKKSKQKHETEDRNGDLLKFVATPWRVTRSHARIGFSIPTQNVEDPVSEESSVDSSTSKNEATDEDYEEANGSQEEESPSEDAVCKVCGFGGRLIQCNGSNCDVFVHRHCMFQNKTGDSEWYCSRCARSNRVLFRNDKV